MRTISSTCLLVKTILICFTTLFTVLIFFPQFAGATPECVGLTQLRARCSEMASSAGGCSPVLRRADVPGIASYACEIYCPDNGWATGDMTNCPLGYLDEPRLTKNLNSDSPANKCASIIQVDNLSIGESIPVVGTQDSLVYFSNRVLGRTSDYTLDIPYRFEDGAYYSSQVLVAGRTFTEPSSPAPTDGAFWSLTWDGKDSTGKSVLGSADAMAQVFF